ncbi:hypothetical protein HY768_06080 [candidate division TA06 bacterium]|uniref:Uncharacterized protein n=1 Tax=candidate division TA06 bacterium TaxID=2250710 RepID=A0A933I940_UNCT6|nr:hypothetical protein [candidate division TA06 bacterium]
MSKKKFKSRNLSQQHLAQAQHRNRYWEKIHFICQACGAPQAFSLLPRRELERLYDLRFLPFRIEAAPGESIPERVVKDCRILVFEQVKRQAMPIVPGGPEITLDDYFNVALSLRHYLKIIAVGEFPGAGEFKQALAIYAGDDGLLNEAFARLSNVLWVPSVFCSDLNVRLYWLTLSFNRLDGDSCLQRNLEVHAHAPERVRAVFDGIPRPASRACWAFCGSGIVKAVLQPSQLGVRGSFADLPHEVFVQSHALQRLEERIDGVPTGLLHYSLFQSLQQPKAINDGQGNILVEYRIFNAKAGYLIADIKDGRVVIRTFLFVTNNGTPEGKRLEEVCGLGRLDKQYLALDKLSTFMAADVAGNAGLQELFRQAGCECLWDLKEKVGPLCTVSGQAPAALLEQYLGLKAKQL